MYTSTVGKTFLREYNFRNGTEYSANEFFDEVFFKLVFDSSKYLMWGENSPFGQGVSTVANGNLVTRDVLKNEEGKTEYFNEENLPLIIAKIENDSSILSFKEEKRKGSQEISIKMLTKLSSEKRLQKLNEFHAKIKNGSSDASIAIGYPASEAKEFATTSGSVTDLSIEVNSDDVYLSWIGAALSLGVSGGYAMLFNNPEITYATFEGWSVYRKFLDDPTMPNIPGNKIVTWNGQWLAFHFGKYYRSDFDFNDFVQRGAIVKNEAKRTVEINTVNWTKLFFSLSNRKPDASLTAYLFSLGQTNKTVGFIPFQFKSGRLLHQIYGKLFGSEDFDIKVEDVESLFGKHIKRACELGNIGLQALEPKDLTKYFDGNKKLTLVKPSIKQKKNESDDDFESRKTNIIAKDRDNIITFRTYKTWLIAMISKNKEELLTYSGDIAAALVKYRAGARKRDRANLIEEKLFAKRSKSEFLESLIQIIQDNEVDTEIASKMKELRDRAFLMNREDFSYLWLLLKFDYSYQERISQS